VEDLRQTLDVITYGSEALSAVSSCYEKGRLMLYLMPTGTIQAGGIFRCNYTQGHAPGPVRLLKRFTGCLKVALRDSNALSQFLTCTGALQP
jgi:hypothetical protein